jgi:excisionase family DNA binding protein
LEALIMSSPMIAPGERRWLSLGEVAETLGLSIHTFRKIRARGGGPRAVKMGKQFRVHVDDLAAWERRNREAGN